MPAPISANGNRPNDLKTSDLTAKSDGENRLPRSASRLPFRRHMERQQGDQSLGFHLGQRAPGVAQPSRPLQGLFADHHQRCQDPTRPCPGRPAPAHALFPRWWATTMKATPSIGSPRALSPPLGNTSATPPIATSSKATARATRSRFWFQSRRRQRPAVRAGLGHTRLRERSPDRQPLSPRAQYRRAAARCVGSYHPLGQNFRPRRRPAIAFLGA